MNSPVRVGSMTVREAVLRLWRALGMTTIFGNPGSTELPLFRDFPADFRYILGLQESLAVGMADGFAQATRNAGLVNLHSAVGVGHAMGNIFTAYKNQTPLVITAGQQARAILPFEPFLFSMRATELPQPYVKWSCEPARAEDVPAALARAYYMAMQPPRGPTFVSIPVDDWDRMCEPLEPRQVSGVLRGDPALLESIARELATAERPAFVVGAAVARDDAWDEVIELAERHQARVWVSPLSARNSFPEDHRLFAGFLAADRVKIVGSLSGHDLILVLGAPAFTYHVEGAGPHVPPGAKLFQLIDDLGHGVMDSCWNFRGHEFKTRHPGSVGGSRAAQPRVTPQASGCGRRASSQVRRSPMPISCNSSRRYDPREVSLSRRRRALAGRCTTICLFSSAIRSTLARAAVWGTACPRLSVSRSHYATKR